MAMDLLSFMYIISFPSHRQIFYQISTWVTHRACVAYMKQEMLTLCEWCTSVLSVEVMHVPHPFSLPCCVFVLFEFMLFIVSNAACVYWLFIHDCSYGTFLRFFFTQTFKAIIKKGASKHVLFYWYTIHNYIYQQDHQMRIHLFLQWLGPGLLAGHSGTDMEENKALVYTVLMKKHWIHSLTNTLWLGE